MIDSGLLAGVTYDDPDRQLYHRVLAQQVGLPLTIVGRDAMAELATACAELSNLGALSFSQFCVSASKRRKEVMAVKTAVTTGRLVPINHYAHPLYRHLKDHDAVRIFEWLKLVTGATGLAPGEVERSHYILESCRFEIVLARTADEFVLVGPLFTQDHIGEGIREPHYSLMRTALQRFQVDVQEFWGSEAEAHDRPIYTVDDLRNVSFQRDRSLYSLVLHRIDFVNRALGRFPEVALLCHQPQTSSRSVVKAVAALSAATRTDTRGIFVTKGFKGGAPEALAVEFHRDYEMRPLEGNIVADPVFEEAYAHNMEFAFGNWARYTNESLARLRVSLLQEPLGGNGPLDEQSLIFGKRLARFLAATFGAIDATLYEVRFTEGLAGLHAVGAYCADAYGDEQLVAMDQHMKDIAGTSREKESISYRCMQANDVQYCQSYDYETRQGIPPSQVFTYPPDGPFSFWGRSACAIPIRVNGILWGVLQLIGRRPHAFPEFVRAKVEEACSIIGSHLFLHGLIGSIRNTTGILSAHELGSGEKKRAVAAALDRMFGSKSFAILRSETLEGEPSEVFLHTGREDLVAASRGEIDHAALAPFVAFAAGDRESWEGTIGDDEFEKLFATAHRRKFYAASEGDFVLLRKIHWDHGGLPASPGIVMLTFPHALGDEEGWRMQVDFACRFVATMTASLHSSDSWEKELREKIGHELSKTKSNLLESVARLDGAERRAASGGQADLSSIKGDLRRHARALDRYTSILTTDRDVSDFDLDPRMYLVKEIWTAWRSDGKRQPADFRELYNTYFFGQLDGFKERRIDVPKLPGPLGLHLDMDELALGEVLATLVDNILKYTCPNTGLQCRDGSTSRSRRILISNIGYRLDEAEADRIFYDGERGRLARFRKPEDGHGFGLFYARQTMLRWQCGLDHVQREPGPDLVVPPGTEGTWTWHDFSLVFPRSLVRG